MHHPYTHRPQNLFGVLEMPPAMSAAMSLDAVAAQPTQTYAAERAKVLKQMAVLTLLAVALMALTWSWFGVLGSMDAAVSTELWAGLRFKLIGGAFGILGLAAAMLHVWIRLVRQVLRMDWA